MGHDIFGYKKSDPKKEIAYLRRGAGSSHAREIYKALHAQDCDGGCSGIGIEKEYTQNELQTALGSVLLNEELEPEHSFLKACIRTGEPVRIFFG